MKDKANNDQNIINFFDILIKEGEDIQKNIVYCPPRYTGENAFLDGKPIYTKASYEVNWPNFSQWKSKCFFLFKKIFPKNDEHFANQLVQINRIDDSKSGVEYLLSFIKATKDSFQAGIFDIELENDSDNKETSAVGIIDDTMLSNFKLIIDTHFKVVYYKGERLKIFGVPFTFLELLARAKQANNGIASRDAIYKGLWGDKIESDNFRNDNTLDSHVYKLRSAFKNSGSEQKEIIITHKGVGFELYIDPIDIKIL